MNPRDDEAELEEEVKALQERLEDKSLYCICLGRDDGTFMILCDLCFNWYHGRCVKISEKEGKQIDKYVCPNCFAAGKGTTTYKPGLQSELKRPRDSQTFDSPERKRQRTETRSTVSREELRAKALVEARRRTEEKMRQKQMEEAERLLEQAEMKKKQEQEEKTKRTTTLSNLKASLEEGLKHDKETSALPQSVLEVLRKKTEHYAREIENALFTTYNGVTVDYLRYYRTLIWNLRDKKNNSLRARVLQGEIEVSALVKMDSQQLANKELSEYRKGREKISFDSVYKRDEDSRIFKKTHKGIEDVDHDMLDVIDNELDKDLAQQRESNPESDDKLRTSNGKAAQLPDQPAPAPDTVLPKLNIDIDLASLKAESLPEPPVNVPEIEPEPYPVPSPPGSPTAQSAPRTWEGRVTFSYSNVNVDFHLTSYHINGTNCEEHLPPVLNVNGRIAFDELLRYLAKLDNSSSRLRTCVYFEPGNNSAEDKNQYKAFFNHLRKSHRGGVIQIDHEACIGVDDEYFKEGYIFPLPASAHVPPFLGVDYDRDLEDMLIGVFITNKKWRPKPDAKKGAPAPTYQYNPPPANISATPDAENAQVEDMDTAIDDSEFVPSSTTVASSDDTYHPNFPTDSSSGWKNNQSPASTVRHSPASTVRNSPANSLASPVHVSSPSPRNSGATGSVGSLASSIAGISGAPSGGVTSSAGNASAQSLKDVLSSIRGILSKTGPAGSTSSTGSTTTGISGLGSVPGGTAPNLSSLVGGIGTTGTVGGNTLLGIGPLGGLDVSSVLQSGLQPSTLDALSGTGTFSGLTGIPGFTGTFSSSIDTGSSSSGSGTYTSRGGGVRKGGTFPRGRGGGRGYQ